MGDSLPRSLSREEQEELVRSKKKVKDVSHVGFQGGQEVGTELPSSGQGAWSGSASFKDKLVGEIPGAFSQAFCFGDSMDEEVVSDEEVETIREGLAAVRFPRELKRQIRTPWSKALIIKVYGRTVGFNFLHNRLLAMWKPTGRLDCVGLGNGFFLTRLSLREDYENILKRGPWFIGEHFLSIRPWEPDFRPETASVTSVAVWVRLNGLPIEYYNPEALCHIGKTIGNVLRVDTHTATEDRGRFARMCVQIDVEKPLITALLIGKFEQQVCYEGIQKLCFSCGRIGHSKETCPYTVLPSPATREERPVAAGVADVHPCKEHVSVQAGDVVGSSSDVQESVLDKEQEGTYGPWIMVERKRMGTKQYRSGGTHLVGDNGLHRQVKGMKYAENTTRMASGNVKFADGPMREAKRKHTPPRVLTEAKVVSAITTLGKTSGKQAHFQNQSPETASGPKVANIELGLSSSAKLKNPSGSSKGKRGAERSKGSKGSSTNNPQTPFSHAQEVSQVPLRPCAHSNGDGKPKGSEEGLRPRIVVENQTSSLPWPEVGFKFGGSNNGSAAVGEECAGGRSFSEGCACAGEDLENGLGVAGPGVADSNFMQSEHVGEVTRTENEGMGSDAFFAHGEQAYAQLACAVIGNGSGCASTNSDSVSRRGAAEGDVEAERMEL